jgi:hypothetical protein
MKNNGWTKFAKYFLDAVGFSDIAARPNNRPGAGRRRIATHCVNSSTCNGKSICERAADKATCPDDKNIFPRNRTYVWHSTYLISFHLVLLIESCCRIAQGVLQIDRRLYQNQQEKPKSAAKTSGRTADVGYCAFNCFSILEIYPENASKGRAPCAFWSIGLISRSGKILRSLTPYYEMDAWRTLTPVARIV